MLLSLNTMTEKPKIIILHFNMPVVLRHLSLSSHTVFEITTVGLLHLNIAFVKLDALCR